MFVFGYWQTKWSLLFFARFLNMDRNVYKAILAKVTLPLSAWPHFEAVARSFGVSFATVFSIYSQEVQNRVLRTNHLVKGSIASHAERYLSGKRKKQICAAERHPAHSSQRCRRRRCRQL